jgi:hypothetical protein
VVDDANSKAAFRRWAREHHPDVGGDPGVFAAGVQAEREGRWEEFITCGCVQAGTAGLPAEPRPHTQVYVRRSARGVVRLYVAARRWQDKRHMPPRVH